MPNPERTIESALDSLDRLYRAVEGERSAWEGVLEEAQLRGEDRGSEYYYDLECLAEYLCEARERIDDAARALHNAREHLRNID